MNWIEITETHKPPYDALILVKGGRFFTDLTKKEACANDYAVCKHRLVKYDEDGDVDCLSEYWHQYEIDAYCYYSMWVEEPTHYIVLPILDE